MLRSPASFSFHPKPNITLRKALFIIVLSFCLGVTPAVAQDLLLQQIERVDQYLEAADYERADSLLRQINPEVKATKDPERIAAALHLEGYLHLETGDSERAQETFREALQLTSQALPADHPAVAQSHNDLGHYFFTVRQLDSAWYHHQLALTARQQKFGQTHPKVADSYNNLGNIWQLAGQPEQALTLYQQVLDIRRTVANEQPLDYAAALNNLGNAYLSLGRLNEAANTLRQCLQIRQQLLEIQHPSIGKTLQNLSITFLEAGQLDSAEYYNLAALENARLNYHEGHPQLASLYENLGNCYLQRSALDQAEQWYRQALTIREAHAGADPVSPAFTYLHLGDLFRQKSEFLEALRWTEKGERLLHQHLSSEDPAIADALEKIGLCHLELGHVWEAERAFSDVRDLRWQVYGRAHPQIAGVLTNLGNVYWEDDDFAAAIYYYQDALAVWAQVSGDHALPRAKLYSNIGNSYLKEENWVPALDAYREALQLMGSGQTGLQADIWQQMGVAYDGLQQFRLALQACQTARDLLLQLSGESGQKQLLVENTRANILLHSYQRGGDTDTLRLAAKTYQECLNALKEQQAGLTHLASKQQTVSLHYDLFSGAIECDLALWELEGDSTYLWSAFQRSELSKSMRLRTQLTPEQLEHSSTSALSRSLQVETAAARQLQQHLSGERGMLVFFAGPQKLFWFFLHEGRLRAGAIVQMSQINELTTQLGRSITAYPFAASAERPLWDSVYRTSAVELYQLIWQPVADHISAVPNLIIVPDGALAYLPFPALLTAQPSKALRYRTYPFLLHDHQISYAYSAAWLAKTMLLPESNGKQQCLAMAPTFEGYEPVLDPLEFNGKEVEELNELVGATILQGKSATLAAFWEQASRYKILHLATHGIDNIYRGDYSYLAFTKPDAATEGRLFVEDLFQRTVDADLVVMSACESGVGRYQAGEGAISLGRGFIAAGAKSVLSTFWSVNDAKSVNFMLEFYQQLRAGFAKDAALLQVQRNYVSTATQEEAHPFYWAAYFPVGDMRPMAVGRTGARWWLLIAVGLMFIAWFSRSKIRALKNYSK